MCIVLFLRMLSTWSTGSQNDQENMKINVAPNKLLHESYSILSFSPLKTNAKFVVFHQRSINNLQP